MKRVSLSVALAACAAVEAAEPTAAEFTAAPPAQTAPAPAAASAPAVPDPKPALRKPLDLRIGDVRNYMMPNEYREALAAPDADNNTVVVEGRREQVPMKFEKPIPGGIIAPFWGLAHPLQAWRLFVPDVQHAPQDGPREPAEKVPPPIFRWGP